MSETTGCWSQLGLVMWRQVWLTRIRRRYGTTIVQVAAMLLVTSSVWNDSVAPYRAKRREEHFFDPADAIQFWGRRGESWTNGDLAFAPNLPLFANLAGRVCASLGGTWTPVPFADAEAATKYVEETASSGSGQRRRVAVWFNRTADDKLTYHVRIPDGMFDTQDDYVRELVVPGPADTDGFDEMRLLLPLQYFVESSFIDVVNGSQKKSPSLKVELMRFPYPALFYGSEDRTLSHVVLRFAIGFFVPFCILVVTLAWEKRTGAKVRP
ncbi:uncharacterized protein LOC144167012 [Haemaphysalis longicornis]